MMSVWLGMLVQAPSTALVERSKVYCRAAEDDLRLRVLVIQMEMPFTGDPLSLDQQPENLPYVRLT